ncbi:hypothetical protein Tsubulata_046868 [Turnera subulata]|uniref:Pectinesterase inhibitor domain-containing protein n=1 Tax=Turnera subulata TaxID=218843 RepID=A0A9Q0JES3_9ROSI|nr:hypothetical protein Tsubulata_046868 [Turnera subulata]
MDLYSNLKTQLIISSFIFIVFNPAKVISQGPSSGPASSPSSSPGAESPNSHISAPSPSISVQGSASLPPDSEYLDADSPISQISGPSASPSSGPSPSKSSGPSASPSSGPSASPSSGPSASPSSAPRHSKSSAPSPSKSSASSPSREPASSPDADSPASAADSPGASVEADAADADADADAAAAEDDVDIGSEDASFDLDSLKDMVAEKSPTLEGFFKDEVVGTATKVMGSSKAAMKSPEVEKICKSTDYPELCVGQIAPFFNGKTDTISILEMSIKSALEVTKLAAQEAKRLAGESSTDDDTATALQQCQEDYDDAVANLKSALDAIPAKDTTTINTMLSAALSDFGACGEAFSSKNPLQSYDDKVSNMTSNCIAIASQVK